MGKQKEKWC